MSAATITLVASIVVMGVVCVILAFASIVFWKAFKKSEERKHKSVSAKKAGRAQARPGKIRKK